MVHWSSKCKNKHGEFEVKFITTKYSEYQEVLNLVQEITNRNMNTPETVNVKTPDGNIIKKIVLDGMVALNQGEQIVYD